MRSTPAALGLLLALAIPAPGARAAQIRVSQESRPGAGDFSRHILGRITPGEARGKAAADVYAYGRRAEYSYSGTRPVLRPDTSHLFFVRTREGLVLFLVHDRPENPDGGHASMRVVVRGDPDGLRLLVRDDPFSENDHFETRRKGREVLLWHAWFPCCTDGAALGTLEGRWKVTVEFLGGITGEGRPGGLKGWVAISAGGGEIRLRAEVGRRVLLEPEGFLVRGKGRPRRAGRPRHAGRPRRGRRMAAVPPVLE